tara:strand:- start:216 stop:770 length:555 start_codon:yes stop_codon:yes gene_type:complete
MLARDIVWLLAYVGCIWAVEFVNTLLGHRLNDLGILPREAIGLKGIIFSPFLHDGFGHVMANTVPLVLLGGFVTLLGRNTLLRLSASGAIFGGLGVWLFGRHGAHVGASGLVFAYFGFLLARGWYERSFVSIMVSVVVLVFYGGMIFATTPFIPNVSWEGHLFGLIAGIVYAKFSYKHDVLVRS